jgi:glycerol-3-phosphate dehydrogenase (NAD(P)+)
MKITILGRGAWGRAISTLVEQLGHEVDFASHRDGGWRSSDKPDYVLLALPVQHVRETLKHFTPPNAPVLSLSKGLEITTGERVSQIVTDVWGETRVGALSGPTFALSAPSRRRMRNSRRNSRPSCTSPASAPTARPTCSASSWAAR